MNVKRRMMRNLKIKTISIFAFCAFAVNLLSIVIFAQQSREDGVRDIEAKLFDASSATYKLSPTYNGRGFQFCNFSNVRVTGYKIGCVKRKKGELRILSERDFQTTELKPKDKGSECQFWISNHGFFPTGECEKGKLAVIEVALGDGTMWKLK